MQRLLTEADKEQLIAYRKEGLKLTEIKQMTKWSLDTIKRATKGCIDREIRMSQKQTQQIRELKESGTPVAHIAKMYNVSAHKIRCVLGLGTKTADPDILNYSLHGHAFVYL